MMNGFWEAVVGDEGVCGVGVCWVWELLDTSSSCTVVQPFNATTGSGGKSCMLRLVLEWVGRLRSESCICEYCIRCDG